jgi:hypothetical protein
MASPDRPPPTTWKRHPIFARVFARLGPAMDAQGAAEHRRALLAGLAGRVLEVGAGNGLNFSHLPAGRHRGPRGRARTLPTKAGGRDRRTGTGPHPCPGRHCRRAPGARREHGRRRRLLGAVFGVRPGQGARRALPGAPARRRAPLLRACSGRYRWPGPGSATRRPDLAHARRRLPHQPRHPGRHHRRRLPGHQLQTVSLPRQSHALARRTPCAGRRPSAGYRTSGRPPERGVDRVAPPPSRHIPGRRTAARAT